jgi:predicted nuclease with TOPRIM domain
MLHQFSPAEPKGQRTCPKCRAGISGATVSGRCSDLQTKDSSTKGDNEHCDYDFQRKLTKKQGRIKELEAQLTACGGAVTQLQIENARLMDENAHVSNNYYRPSLSRGNSMTSPGSTTSQGSLGDVGNFDDLFGDEPVSPSSSSTDVDLNENTRLIGENTRLIGENEILRQELDSTVTENKTFNEMIDILNNPVSPTSHSSEDALREENAHLRRQLDNVRNQMTALLHNINADG